MNLFYAPTTDISGNSITLKGQESKHAAKALRLKIGDEIYITDGCGHLYSCEVANISKSDLTASVLNKKFEEKKSPWINLIVGVLRKKDRLEFAIEKAVELGVDKLILFKGDHSEKHNVREDRLVNTAISAMKQSLRVYLPEIIYSKSLNEGLKSIEDIGSLVVADETSDKESDLNSEKSTYTLIVGPEGGFSENERNLLSEKQATAYSLGEKRLRTETAAMIITDRFRSELT